MDSREQAHARGGFRRNAKDAVVRFKCCEDLNFKVSLVADTPATVVRRGLMLLDTPTLLVTTVYITALLGGLLLFSWAQTRSGIALAIAGTTFLLLALGIGLLGVRGIAPDFVTISLADGIFALSHGLLYSSVRVFNHRPPIFLSATIGAGVWLFASEFDLFIASEAARAVVISLIVAGYSFLLASEFSRTRKERLPSARAASALSAMHGLFFLGRAIFITGWGWHPAASAFAQSWSSIITFETLTATIILAFLFMGLAKERAEDGYRHAALVDFLTGISNRRAFMEAAEETIRREAECRRTLSLLLFDLDRFKAINDEYGHQIGDQVLRSFCAVVLQLLPAGAIFGRLGGEEFAALIAQTEISEAHSLADRIREAAAANPVFAGGNTVHVTTSVGVASSPEAQVGLSELLSAADAALYLAKSQGRNRVEMHGLEIALEAGRSQRGKVAAR